MAYPTTYSAWRRSEGTRAPAGQRLTISISENETLPTELEPHDVVIKIHVVSLNFREVGMLIGQYPSLFETKGIPGSDAAAEVVAVGPAVSRYKVGDRVMPITGTGPREPDDDATTVMPGVNAPGVLREYAIFPEKHLVPIPAHLSWEEASTLPCAGVTAWNALDGLRYVPKNATALLQGTGGVSMFALILCLSAGIRPIITSSSDEKLASIKALSPEILGLNYKTVANQTAEVMRLTNGRGVDFVINSTGPQSFIDDIDALCDNNGTVSLVGFLAGFEANWKHSDLLRLMNKRAKLKGISMGSKADFEEMNRYIEAKKIRFDALLNEKPFVFKDTKEAYERLESGKFSGKIVIKIAE